jgi:Fe-S cluster assembly ATP-binding protein
LELKDLHVSIGDKEIVKGVNLAIRKGEKHALMGPNGSGKSTLVNALMGHPSYQITAGQVLLRGEEMKELKPDERARKGMFLALQYPVAVPGVSVANFLRAAVKARFGSEVSATDFRKTLKKNFKLLEIDESFATRYLNDGFSGGEKKRLEILQLSMLKPHAALLDETDSGLDIDALRIVSEGINKTCGEETGVLVVTHYQRLLNYVKPNFVHVLIDGKIVRSGGPELALELDEKGYEIFTGGSTKTLEGSYKG